MALKPNSTSSPQIDMLHIFPKPPDSSLSTLPYANEQKAITNRYIGHLFRSSSDLHFHSYRTEPSIPCPVSGAKG